MTSELSLEIGMPVDSSDHHWGVLDDIVIDPVRLKVTHLVVQPRYRHHKARLIPLDAVVSCDDRIRLSLSTEQIVAAPKVEATDFVRYQGDRYAGLGHRSALLWPYYSGIGTSSVVGYGYGYGFGAGFGLDSPALATTTYDRVPSGTVEIHRDSEVVTSDHHVVGHVDGFVTDADGAITHLVLGHGHLWAHREITIPLADIAKADCDSVRLSVTRDAVAEYPSVPFERH
ncbi:MAG: hypothetical protein WBM50_25455 [Acidimicrobiales bacterium]